MAGVRGKAAGAAQQDGVLIEIKFETPPVYATANGALYIKAEELLQSQRFHDLLAKMMEIKNDRWVTA